MEELKYRCRLAKSECILPEYCAFFEFEQSTCKYLRMTTEGETEDASFV